MNFQDIRIKDLKWKLELSHEDMARFVSNLEKAEAERDELKAKVAKLERWKASAIALHGEWDMQAIAEMLGAQCGQSCSRVISEQVPKLLDKVKRLETAGDLVEDAACRVQEWSGTRLGDALDNWQKAKQPIP